MTRKLLFSEHVTPVEHVEDDEAAAEDEEGRLVQLGNVRLCLG